MPTLVEIEDVQGALETGLAAGIASVMGTNPYVLAGTFQRATPRTEIIITVGNATGARRAFPDTEVTRFVRWNFTAKFTVITLPAESLTKNDGESDSDFQGRINNNFQLHEQMVSTLRSYASTAAQASWADEVNFPIHFIAEALRDMNSPKKTKTEEGNYQTVLTFSGVVGIHESAWQQLTT